LINLPVLLEPEEGVLSVKELEPLFEMIPYVPSLIDNFNLELKLWSLYPTFILA
jgi:hypothetical protein